MPLPRWLEFVEKSTLPLTRGVVDAAGIKRGATEATFCLRVLGVCTGTVHPWGPLNDGWVGIGLTDGAPREEFVLDCMSARTTRR